MEQKILNQLSLITEQGIRDKYHNVVSKELLIDFVEAYKIIKDLVEIDPETILPRWFKYSLDHATTLFVNIFANPSPARLNDFLTAFIFGQAGTMNADGSMYSLPWLQNWYQVNFNLSYKLENIQDDLGDDAFNERFNKLSQNIKTQVDEFDEQKKELKKSLDFINKQVGKIAVKEYAGIFEDQANEHSSNLEVTWKWLPAIKLGTADKWLMSGFILLIALIVLIFRIDSVVVIDGATWTPSNIVHLFGRGLLLSLIIFLISFSFKQYRVNMHLYTVNKHRANTLKSFEYLTKAPDKLEAASYNAILMEVAKSIYESGQTGYITTTETNSDMPSIIDMTKVITNSK